MAHHPRASRFHPALLSSFATLSFALPALAQPGACCFPNGTCYADSGEFPCTSHGGVFLGGGTICDGCSGNGACCIPHFGVYSCSITSHASCTAQNGVFQGIGAPCDPSPCPPPPTGACCIGSGCQSLSVEQCVLQGGIYRGDNSPCTLCPCYANCDDSTTTPILNVADFTCYLTRFAAADPRANCDNSTNSPALNILDFLCFLGHFASGC